MAPEFCLLPIFQRRSFDVIEIVLPLFGAGSSPPMVMASAADWADRRTQNKLETTQNFNQARTRIIGVEPLGEETATRTATNTTLWEPKLQMSSLPPPFTMNGTGAIVFFLHIPKTGKSAVLRIPAMDVWMLVLVFPRFASLTHLVVLLISRGYNHTGILEAKC